jgi:hypothetical protein
MIRMPDTEESEQSRVSASTSAIAGLLLYSVGVSSERCSRADFSIYSVCNARLEWHMHRSTATRTSSAVNPCLGLLAFSAPKKVATRQNHGHLFYGGTPKLWKHKSSDPSSETLTKDRIVLVKPLIIPPRIGL